MNKFFARIFAVLAVLGLALGASSCNKDGNKNTGLGFWQVESEDASHSGYSNLYHAWYNIEEKEDYSQCSVLFLPKDDREHWHDYDYAYVTIPSEGLGLNLDLFENLAVPAGDFYAGTKTVHIGNGEASDGTVFLSINRENNNVIFRLNGTKDGDKIKIDYVGYATPVPDRPFSFL